MEHKEQAPLVLPLGVVSRTDLGRLLRETEALHDFLEQAAIRHPGTGAKMPRTSRLMEECISQNKLNVLHAADRQRLHSFLLSVKAKAPVMHMSFSADPSPRFINRLMTYLRGNIHPLVLLDVGLQPNIGAGCIVRTTNKHFDFSLRTSFAAKRGLLISKIRGDEQPAAVPEEAPAS